MARPAGNLFVLVAVTAAWLSPPAATAGSLAVSPLKVELRENAPTAALTLRNEESRAVVVQAQAYSWEQADGEERLAATQDLIVSPAVFTLQGESSQLLRVALRRAVDPGRELSYRLILQEVPQQASPEFTGLAVALRLSLPVFVAPRAGAEPEVSWSATPSPDGGLVVSARNDGLAHYRLFGFEVTPEGVAGGTLRQPVASYILAGRTRSWTLPGDKNNNTNVFSVADSRHLRLKGITDRGGFETELTLSDR